MDSRNYLPGDEDAQAAIFNAAAGGLPGYKPASAQDVRRRTQSRSFDATLWHYAVENGNVVGYCMTQSNGRIGYPWCMQGFESASQPLFRAALDGLQKRGVQRVYAAYAASWTGQAEFFSANGMPQAREIINFVQDLTEMPTRMSRGAATADPFRPDDVSALIAMAPELWRGQSEAELRKDWFESPFVPTASMFVVRSRADQQPLAVGRLVEDPAFADPTKLDATQPCFRLGAFGNEGLAHKRINGLFSLVLPRVRSAAACGLELMEYAASRLDGTAATAMAAQVSTDAPHLLAFYQSHFRRQASFPVFERVFDD